MRIRIREVCPECLERVEKHVLREYDEERKEREKRRVQVEFNELFADDFA